MEKRWLSLKEAAKYASIGENRLQMMAHSGTVRACQDRTNGTNKWIFDRLSLDAYYEAQMTRMSTAEKVLAIRRGEMR